MVVPPAEYNVNRVKCTPSPIPDSWSPPPAPNLPGWRFDGLQVPLQIPQSLACMPPLSTMAVLLRESTRGRLHSVVQIEKLHVPLPAQGERGFPILGFQETGVDGPGFQVSRFQCLIRLRIFRVLFQGFCRSSYGLQGVPECPLQCPPLLPAPGELCENHLVQAEQ